MYMTVKVHSYTRDRHGDIVAGAVTSVPGCVFAPSTSSEDTDHKAQVVRDARLGIPPGVVISATDKVELADGTVWHVTGESQQYVSPFGGWAPGGEVSLRRVTG